MIVTILPSSSNFHAVGYNENKVAKGEAYLMEIKNFEDLNTFGYDKPEDLIEFLNDYSQRNTHIKNPQLHIAFSCKGQEMSHQELLEFAHQYLNEMGYGDPDQPLLVYAHQDTDNNHIHVISSRVDPRGNKIDHNNERRRSQKVIEKLLGNNERLRLQKTLSDITDFNFRSVAQYQAILEASGYECYEKNGKLNIKRGGMVLANIDIDIIEKKALLNENKNIELNYKKWFGIISKYKDLNNDLDGLKKDLRKKFGAELVFFGRKDSPFGFVLVDFNNKVVYEGSKIMSIKRLRQFPSSEERKSKIEDFINKILNESPKTTLKELNSKLKKLNAYISKDKIVVGKDKFPIRDTIKDLLDKNNKLNWVYSFYPQSQDEFKLLLNFVGLKEDQTEIPAFFSQREYNQETVDSIKRVFNTSSWDKIKNELSNSGYRLIRYNGKDYIYSNQQKILIDLDKINIKLPHEAAPSHSKQNKPNTLNLRTQDSPSQGANREWEVGTKGKWDEVDNGQQMKY